MIYGSKYYFTEKQVQWINEKVADLLSQGYGIALGENTIQFEEEFASYIKTDYAVATSACTSALVMSLKFLDIAGKDVLVPTNTFIATPNSVTLAGGNPKFCDIDPRYLCLTLDSIKKAYTSKTKGVIVVHFGGLIIPEIDEIKKWCEKKGLFLLEDSAHAIGAKIQERFAGSIGNMGCFSFFESKIMTTGEGGMITTNDKKLYEFAKRYQNHGRAPSDNKESLDFFPISAHNYKMSDVSAILGLAQLRGIEENISLRHKIATIYDKHLGDIPKVSVVNDPPSGFRHVYYKYSALLDEGINRVQVRDKLKEKGVMMGWLYYHPCHMQPAYKEGQQPLPVAEDVLKRQITLPLYPQLANNQKDLQLVLEAFSEVFNES